MLLGFKSRFAAFVENGTKTHTIRATRKITPHAGEICHCYANPRQKTMRLLGRWPCIKVEPVQIFMCGDGRFSVHIGEHELTQDEKDLLAWRDGFRSYKPAFVEMMRFWSETHGNSFAVLVNSAAYPPGEPVAITCHAALDFSGHLIHWDYSRGF